MNESAETAHTFRSQPPSDERWASALAALDCIDQGISVVDRQLRLIGWNRRFLELLDFPSIFGHVGQSFTELIRYNAYRGEYGPGDPEKKVKEWVEIAKQFEPHCFERTRPNGTVLEVRGNPIVGGGFVTVYTDITDRRRAEAALAASHDELETRVAQRTSELQALYDRLAQEVTERKRIANELRESEAWMRLIMDAIPARIAYVGADRRYYFANKKHEEFYGIPADQFIGRHAGKVVDTIPSEDYQTHIDTVLSGKKTSFEYSFTNPENRTFYIRSTFIPHFGSQHKVLGYFILGEDHTEYKKTQLALNQIQKMEAIAQLTGGIAHDFNNLLTVIMGELGFLEDEPGLSEDARDALQTAANASKRGAELTRRLLAFSRRQTLQPRAVNLHELLLDLKRFLQRTLGPAITVEIGANNELDYALADPNELNNALLNLAINARDAMPTGGKLTINASNAVPVADELSENPDAIRPGDYVLLKIVDSGVGMSPETLNHAFEPFFTTKDPGAGTGLGLSMVYGFSKQSGGHIQIESQIDIGTTIKLYLPKAQAPKAQPAQTVAKETRDDRANLLLVEDDPDVRKFIVRVLMGLGYTVRATADGKSALTMLAQNTDIDLLLTDIIMPGEIDGWALIAETQQRYPHIKILYMSGYTDKTNTQPPQLTERINFLRKPFSKQALANAVRATLERAVYSN